MPMTKQDLIHKITLASALLSARIEMQRHGMHIMEIDLVEVRELLTECIEYLGAKSDDNRGRLEGRSVLGGNSH
jgi:hypothetical protein